MENPGLRTLISFLNQIKKQAPVNFSGLAQGRRRGYGMVNRYLRYCLGKDLIIIVSERRTRGRYPSKTYALSERGSKLLAIFDEEKEETTPRGPRPH
ncbi:MAG: hypothetical protein NWE88_09585 [Candidatus Bathyarchaeota archaeon]|nr:hypothetical protein [Candidatus Bathyarchaeota archaeon]